MTGVVHLSKNNTGVLSSARTEASRRAKAGMISMFSTQRDCESTVYPFFWLEGFSDPELSGKLPQG